MTVQQKSFPCEGTSKEDLDREIRKLMNEISDDYQTYHGLRRGNLLLFRSLLRWLELDHDGGANLPKRRMLCARKR